ncbi:MAG: hypothetical protein Q9162_005542 [Coniocarpon cinnabarinum]
MELSKEIKKRKAAPADEVKIKRQKQPTQEHKGPDRQKPRERSSSEAKISKEINFVSRSSQKTDGKPVKTKFEKKSKTSQLPAEVAEDDKDSRHLTRARGSKSKEAEEDDFCGFDTESDEEDGGAILSKDQTAELLKGFESSSESDDLASAVEGDEPDGTAQSSLQKTAALPQAAENALSRSKKSRGNKDQDPPITLYIGRAPHGFYRHQMHAYFSQFGEIAHLRLAHNRRTGVFQHYGFIEFVSGEVGRIVQRTMHGYIMFGHILQVKQVPQSKLDEHKAKGIDIWKGEKTRFHKIPWRKLEREQMQKASREQWMKRTENETSRRQKKAKKLKELGYDFEMPALKSVADIKEPRPETVAEEDNSPTAESAPAVAVA